MLRWLFCIVVILLGSMKGTAQLTVNSGNDTIICNGVPVSIGKSLKINGGTAPFSYLWHPALLLNDSTLPNPVSSVSTVITFTVTVKDVTGATATATRKVTWDPIALVNAGDNKSICPPFISSAEIGGIANNAGGIGFAWTPATDLNSSSVGNPVASPTVTTTYSLTATSSNCPSKTSKVTVTVNPPLPVNAGQDQTIQQGQTVTLKGSGASFYIWVPGTGIKNPYLSQIDVEPDTSTTYVLFGSDQSGCQGVDTVRITVIPGYQLFFYNTFTPNKDGDNDTWYIGNANKFPSSKLEIYNRNGQVVFRANGYKNDWNGFSGGEELPAATYYYVFDPGDGSKKYAGSVTIIR